MSHRSNAVDALEHEYAMCRARTGFGALWHLIRLFARVMRCVRVQSAIVFDSDAVEPDERAMLERLQALGAEIAASITDASVRDRAAMSWGATPRAEATF